MNVTGNSPGELGAAPALERRTIEPIPVDERHGTSWGLFRVWFGENISPLGVVTGAIGTSVLGLPFWWAVVAILVGNFLGGIAMALHAAQGPQLGVPQMLQSRGQFGAYGASLLVLLAIILALGFFASNLIVSAQSLQQVIDGMSLNTGIVLCLIVSLVLSICGYDLIRWAAAWNAYIVGALALYCFASIAFGGGVPAGALTAGEFTVAGFGSMVAIGAVWQIGYAIYVSDYSRYMPVDTGTVGAFWGTYLGTALGTSLMFALGALVGSAVPDADTLAGLDQLVGFGSTVVFIGFAIAAATTNTVNAYSGSVCMLTIGETFKRGWIPSLRARVVATVLLNFAGLLIALLGQGDFITNYLNFVTLLLYALIPWSAINLVDYYLIRKGHYDVEAFFRADGGRYGLWNTKALAVYVVGLLVQVPFMVTALYTGPFGDDLSGIDFAWVIGMVVSAVLYYVLAKNDGVEERPQDSERSNAVPVEQAV